MEFWNSFTTLLTTRIEALGISSAQIPVALVIAALLFPLLLAALARQPLAFFAVLLVICGLLAIDPSTASAGALVAIGAYVASVLIGVIAAQNAYRTRRLSSELSRLREDFERFRQVEERQLIDKINASAAVPAAAVAAPAVAAPAVALPDPPPEPMRPAATAEPVRPGEPPAPRDVLTLEQDSAVSPPAKPVEPEPTASRA
jgi:hypothetical protein